MTITLVDALTTITDLTKTQEPMVSFITREVNLYLDVLRVYGKRDKLSETDVHILCARLLDLAQIAPLAEPPASTIPFGPGKPINMDDLGNEIERKPTASLKILKPKAQPEEVSNEIRL